VTVSSNNKKCCRCSLVKSHAAAVYWQCQASSDVPFILRNHWGNLLRSDLPWKKDLNSKLLSTCKFWCKYLVSLFCYTFVLYFVLFIASVYTLQIDSITCSCVRCFSFYLLLLGNGTWETILIQRTTKPKLQFTSPTHTFNHYMT